MTILGLIYFFSPIGQKFWYVDHWYNFFLLTFGPILILQTILHWFALKYLYPKRNKGNLIWVLLMPVLLVIGYAEVTLILFAIGLSQLHD